MTQKSARPSKRPIDARILAAVERNHGNAAAAARDLSVPVTIITAYLTAIPLANRPEIVLWHRYRRCSTRLDIRDHLVDRYLPLVRSVAVTICAKLPRYIDLDTLVAAGHVGLLGAIDRYDHTRSIKFATYATRRIHGAILDELRLNDHAPRKMRQRESQRLVIEQDLTSKLGRSPTPNELQAATCVVHNLTPSQFEASYPPTIEDLHWSHDDTVRAEDAIRLDEPATSPAKPFPQLTTTTAFARATTGLPFESRIVLYLYHAKGHTFRQIGETLHLCESRCCQIYAQSIVWLREHKSREKLLKVLM